MTPSDRSSPPLRAVRTDTKCPVCSKPVDLKVRPFCSKRCADIDLGRWLKESYRVPSDETPDDEAGEGPDGRPRHGP
ncbi:MAG: DNA gyrase inhibitor YacG [Alphaproteobacteria bacterium]|nr:DNA gyrase inhibitor YacG [Alphaproteobacteria bacterium]